MVVGALHVFVACSTAGGTATAVAYCTVVLHIAVLYDRIVRRSVCADSEWSGSVGPLAAIVTWTNTCLGWRGHGCGPRIQVAWLWIQDPGGVAMVVDPGSWWRVHGYGSRCRVQDPGGEVWSDSPFPISLLPPG